MIWFQWVVLPLIGVMILRSIRHLLRGARPRALWVQSLLLWVLAGLAVWHPELTTRVAALMGIGRGADLVLYGLVIAFLAFCFFSYGKWMKVESELTEIVRHLAIEEAKRQGYARKARAEAESEASSPEINSPDRLPTDTG